MKRIPIFVEAFEAVDAFDPKRQREKSVYICTQIWQRLVKRRIVPLPFASSLVELDQILGSMKKMGQQPAIFIINTYLAKDMLEHIDPMMGETPTVYLRRELFSGQSGLMERLLPDPNQANTMHVLGRMTPRLTSIWSYGSKNADYVAQRAEACMLQFLEDGDFRHWEIANKAMAS